MRFVFRLCVGMKFMFHIAVRDQSAASTKPGYVGSEQCKSCHAALYARWTKTRMANLVRDPAVHPEAITPDLKSGSPLVTFHKDDIGLSAFISVLIFHTTGSWNRTNSARQVSRISRTERRTKTACKATTSSRVLCTHAESCARAAMMCMEQRIQPTSLSQPLFSALSATGRSRPSAHIRQRFRNTLTIKKGLQETSAWRATCPALSRLSRT